MHGIRLTLTALLAFATPSLAAEPNLPPNWIDVPIEDVATRPNRQLIRLDLKEKRVYLFGVNGIVAVYSVAIGKKGWETPKGTWTVRDKIANPAWTNFITRKVVPPGPNNPMGSRWIGFWTDGKDEIGFHGTKDVRSIGKAASHGCIRMRDADVKHLFDRVAVGTQVIVN